MKPFLSLKLTVGCAVFALTALLSVESRRWPGARGPTRCRDRVLRPHAGRRVQHRRGHTRPGSAVRLRPGRPVGSRRHCTSAGRRPSPHSRRGRTGRNRGPRLRPGDVLCGPRAGVATLGGCLLHRSPGPRRPRGAHRCRGTRGTSRWRSTPRRRRRPRAPAARPTAPGPAPGSLAR